MAVGLQGRGKTTLLSVLRNPTSPLPANVSTVGVVMAEWVVPPPAYVVKAKKGQVPTRVCQVHVHVYILFMCIVVEATLHGMETQVCTVQNVYIVLVHVWNDSLQC